MIAAIIAVALVVPPPAGTDVNRILTAIAAVETGGERQPDRAVGDNGKALGRFQIWEVYWKDARIRQVVELAPVHRRDRS